MFKDRIEAGTLLARALGFIRNNGDLIVLAVPRGGVPVADEVARVFGAPLDLIITRKIGAPGNPELAIGAVTQDGETMVDRALVESLRVPQDYISAEAARQSAEVKRRLALYRGVRPYPNLAGRAVVIVDDGIATGSTLLAAIESAKSKGAKSIIVAAPVGAQDSVSLLSKSADRVVCLSTPEPFYAIGQFYEDFRQVTDEQVRSILSSRRRPDLEHGEG